MEVDGEVARLAVELVLAVEITMNPLAAQRDRMEAYTVCQRFKESSPFCSQTGLLLASDQFPLPVRHFGLQLMEHTVKYKWYTISRAQKLFVKENAMKLLASGVGAAEDASLMPLKDALSRVIVEMIKQEWPQPWTTLLAELWDISYKGEAQTELVLLVFLRLMEDVALLETMESSHRRKAICSALTENMADIFDFFMRLILLHLDNFRSAHLSRSPQALSHARVMEMVLLTITSFMEWVAIEHILATEGHLLLILCILLNDTAFQVRASECLARILSHKKKIPPQLLFRTDLITYIHKSVAEAEASMLPEAYTFFKNVVSVLNGLASHVTGTKTKEEGIPCQSPSFLKFLETVMMVTRHPSLTVAHRCALIWITLLRCKHIANDPTFISYLPQIIGIASLKIVRVTYPDKRPVEITMDPRVFAGVDYESAEEFALFFNRCRIDFIEIFRLAMISAPLVTFGFCEQWMSLRLQKALAGEVTSLTIHDPVYMEWEVLSYVLDAVTGYTRLVSEPSKIQSGLRLLEECLKVNTTNLLVLSIILSCISALLMFLNISSAGASLLPRVLQKIFACVVYTDQSPDPEAVKNLRRQSSVLMVRLAIKYPLLLLPLFDEINSAVQGLIATPNQLSWIEKINLQESLLQLSNHFCNYERQTIFLGEIMAEGCQQWMAMVPAFKSPQDFIHFVGLDIEPTSEEVSPTAINRKQLTYAINIVAGVIRRCSWLDDPDRASRGGFVVGLTESGNPIHRNPAAPHIIPLLPHILSLAQVMNELFSNLHLMVESFKGVLAIPKTEQCDFTGMPVIKVEVDQMQEFLHFVYKTNIQLIGGVAWSLGQEFYQIPGIADAVIRSVFVNMENVPDYRLRTIHKFLLRHFVISCPPAFYDSVLLPIFVYLTSFMLNRLSCGKLGGIVIDTREELHGALASEYLEVLKIALVVYGRITDHNNAMFDEKMDLDDLSMDWEPQQLSRTAQKIISDLGGKLLHHPPICNSIVRTVLNILTWNDGCSSLKAIVLTAPIIRYLAREGLMTDSLAFNTMMSVLDSLHVHGKDETNLHYYITLGVQIYEILRPKFPIVIEVMKKIPNITVADIQKLDKKIANGSMTGNKIKKGLRELFQKITRQVIAKDSGQFKEEIKIDGLPKIHIKNSHKRNY